MARWHPPLAGIRVREEGCVLDLLDPAIMPSLALRFLYNVGIGLACISVGIFILVALVRSAAFLKWRNYVDAGRSR
jgi:hypothetical protein